MYILAPTISHINVLAIMPEGKSKYVQQYSLADSLKADNVSYNPLNLQGMAAYINK